MDDDRSELKQLNTDTFAAEAKNKIGDEDWDTFLRRVLDEDFRIRRANRTIPLQDREGMIAHIQNSEPNKRNVSNVAVTEDKGYGVVTSIVTLTGSSDRFHNLKVFTRQASDEWRCAYWHVSKLTDQ